MTTFLFVPKSPGSIIETTQEDSAVAFVSTMSTGVSSVAYHPDPDDTEREDIMASLPDAKTVLALIEEGDAPGSMPFNGDIRLNVAPVSAGSLMPLSLSDITKGRDGFVLTSSDPDGDLVLRSIASVHGGVMIEKRGSFYVTPHDLTQPTVINRTGQPDTRNTHPMTLTISEKGRSLSSLDVMAAMAAALAPDGYINLTRRESTQDGRNYHVSITPKEGQRTSFHAEAHGPYTIIRPAMRNYKALEQIIPFLGGDVCYRNTALHSGSACAFGATRSVIAEPDKVLQLSDAKEKILGQCAANGVAELLGKTNEVSIFLTECVRSCVTRDCDGMFIDEARKRKYESAIAIKAMDDAQVVRSASPERT